MIDDPSTGGIDQDAPILHLFKLFLPKRSLGLVIERQVQAHDIAPPQQLVPIGQVLAFEIRRGGDRVPIMIHHLHPESQTTPGDDAPDPTHPDDPDRLSLRVMCRRQSSLPLPRPSVGLGLPILPQRGEDEEHGRRRRRVVHGPGGMGDLDPTGRRRGEVDLVVAGAVVTDVLDGGGQGVDDLGVKDADRVGRVVVSGGEGERASERCTTVSRVCEKQKGVTRGLTGRWRRYRNTCP